MEARDGHVSELHQSSLTQNSDLDGFFFFFLATSSTPLDDTTVWRRMVLLIFCCLFLHLSTWPPYALPLWNSTAVTWIRKWHSAASKKRVKNSISGKLNQPSSVSSWTLISARQRQGDEFGRRECQALLFCLLLNVIWALASPLFPFSLTSSRVSRK